MSAEPTAIVLFTRDLRVHDNPALELACRSARRVVPLFVVHEGLGFATPNRRRFLHESLADLRENLRGRGGELIVRYGDPVVELLRLAGEVHAETIVLARDVSRYAQRRADRIARAAGRQRIRVRTVDSVTVAPPAALTPSGGGDHFRVFTPYWRAWSGHARRTVPAAPDRIEVPAGLRCGRLPPAGSPRAQLPTGGETAARRRMRSWLSGRLADYADRHDDLPGDATSRLSADLHFGTLSPLELTLAAERVGGDGAAAYVRQLCWRDFHAQVTYAFPDITRADYRPRGRDWRDDPDALDAWRSGWTGLPIVDAGMRQLAAEGFLHNRARLLVASFLTKQLGLHWAAGARHFFDQLVDGDIANNAGNWQWVAGTGNDTRPNRRFNLLRQAHRFDPDGAYVRRYVPELAGVAGASVHTPWRLDRPPAGYPAPLLDLDGDQGGQRR
ncbi:deoxyribodipyrimidine photo-lyase [Actinocatenispora thailandica]|uniref:Deoxyribodipyrimidine photo-lyase n=1 Tax=Actinocatenispora thailandica TaxID=227318 RepID=A0A7R7DWM4_9ACTN|nr:deoxyribodipyrimidine photo-lyase [Actinocatenispora thailandica]BCJ39252.1 deoxyribodipyrimidine photo-lyase [Actinocatenispora thailandica]